VNRVRTPSSPPVRERKREIKREKERVKKREGRERERENFYFLFLKGMTGALAPFSYLV
jgi:hypothetical protein